MRSVRDYMSEVSRVRIHERKVEEIRPFLQTDSDFSSPPVKMTAYAQVPRHMNYALESKDPESIIKGWAEYILHLNTTNPFNALSCLEDSIPTNQSITLPEAYGLINTVEYLFNKRSEPNYRPTHPFGPLWQYIDEVIDIKNNSNTNTRRSAMQALETVTKPVDLPALKAFYNNHLDDPLPFWLEVRALSTPYLKVRTKVRFSWIRRTINDAILTRISTTSGNPDLEPVSLVEGDLTRAFQSTYADVERYMAPPRITVFKRDFYTRSGFEIGDDGWIRRIDGARIVQATKDERRGKGNLVTLSLLMD